MKPALRVMWVACGERGHNFGDWAGAEIISQVSHRDVDHCDIDRVLETQIVGAGSTIHLLPASYAGCVWGTGIIKEDQTFRLPHADIRAVRGKLTAQRLGIKWMAMGDPLLLWQGVRRPKFRLGIVPHYVDFEDKGIWHFTNVNDGVLVIDMLARDAADRIATCDLILSSALHGLVIADALGIPNKWTMFSEGKIVGHGFKFRDYYSAFDIDDPIPLWFDDSKTFEDYEKWILDDWEPRPLAKICNDLLDCFPKEMIDDSKPSWDGRNEVIAAMIKGGESVLDLGAGRQSLKRYLPEGCKYVPVDLVKTSSDVIQHDFNNGVPSVGHFDVVVVSGVLEYLASPFMFLREAMNMGERMIVSYSPRTPEQTIESRRAGGWVTHMAKEDIEEMFEALHLDYEEAGAWNEQVIWKLTRK